ncbi:MAG: choice-of-anchor X domain-containing protein [Candidatus Promineifilaceae bacterium]|nr:choice-of-anchor X domain-containing protein [Candidatus Promineifilaceae bacterium]
MHTTSLLKSRWGMVAILTALLLLVTLVFAAPPEHAGAQQGVVGAATPNAATDIAATESLQPAVTHYGLISLSIDALGTTAPSGTVQVDKPANATVRKAYLMAATTGLSNYQLAPGEIALAGSPVVWSMEVPSSISSYNYWGDVTAIVKPIVDAAPAGIVDLEISEGDTFRTDGEVLAVIFEDPNQTDDNTIILYFGAQDVDGDTFTIDFGAPIDKADPNLKLDYSLGISFGCQGACGSEPVEQFSYVDVNGTRLTSAAGGQDDGELANGALITVGGIGDSNTNPPDPNAPPNDDPRTDDELYNVIPFVEDGDTQMVVTTRNPSDDDNIFFAALFLGATRSVNTIDVSISLYNNPTGTDRDPYETIIDYFADAIYEASNGAHKLGEVTFHPNGAESDSADVVWVEKCHPSASPAGAGIAGLHVNMCDIFKDGRGAGLDYDFLATENQQKGGGYTLAHEYGHYYYGVYDEYIGVPSYDDKFIFPHSTDDDVENSIMNSQWKALGGDYDWLNFSIEKNFTDANAQERVYDAPAWETLTREVHEDPRDGQRKAVAVRAHYPELDAVAPEGDNDSSIELPDAAARSALNVVWEAATQRPARVTALPFTPQVSSLLGQNLTYPEPLVLLAFVHRQWMVTAMDVTATLTLPDDTTTTISYRDDGVPPDATANDGLYAAIFSPDQSGIYEIQTLFDITANESMLVPTAFMPATGLNGAVPMPEPVVITQSMQLAHNLLVSTSNVVPDDHGDTPGEATPVAANNVPVPGKIETAGDRDVFAVTTPSAGTTFVRVSNLALGMTPRIRVYDADGSTLLFEEELSPVSQTYLARALDGVAPGTTVYVEVTDVARTASGGLYEFSAGAPLGGEAAQGQLLFLPIIRR